MTNRCELPTYTAPDAGPMPLAACAGSAAVGLRRRLLDGLVQQGLERPARRCARLGADVRVGWRLAAPAAACLAAAIITGPAFAAPKLAQKDARVWSAAEKVRPDQLKLLEQIVNIDTGTGDVEGSQKATALLVPRLQALGMTGETVPA